MRKHILILGALLLAFSMTDCKRDADAAELSHHHHGEHEHGAGHDHDHEHGHEHNHEHDHEHGEAESHEAGEITLSEAMAQRLGVKSDTIEAGTFNSTLRVPGRLMQSDAGTAVATSPAGGIVTLSRGISVGTTVNRGQVIAAVNTSAVSGGDSNAATKAALDAAKRELDRLTPLYNDRLVAASTYNAALAAYEQAKAEYSATASSGKITAPTSGVITTLDIQSGAYATAGQPVATISSGTELLLRADVPSRLASQLGRYTDARIVLPDGSTVAVSEAGGRRTNAALATAGASGGYIPVYFSIPAGESGLVAGQAVEVYLLGQPRQGVIFLPKGAVTEQQGRYFVYRQLDEDCYEKLAVTIGQTDGQAVEITSGVTPGDCIVTEGAIAVKLAESSGNVPEGHSHNH